MSTPAELEGIAVQPASLLPQFDLVIASKKFFGITSDAAAEILWWKLPGKDKEEPPRPCTLTDPAIQRRLLDYDLVNTEARQGMVIRRYRRIATLAEAVRAEFTAAKQEFAAQVEREAGDDPR